MAVAVDGGTNDRLRVAVDGGVSTGGFVYAGPSETNRSYGIGTMQGAVSHRLRAGVVTWGDGVTNLLEFSEGGASAGYALRPSDSYTTRAGVSHRIGEIETIRAEGDSGCTRAAIGSGFYEMKIAAGYLEAIGTIRGDDGASNRTYRMDDETNPGDNDPDPTENDTGTDPQTETEDESGQEPSHRED